MLRKRLKLPTDARALLPAGRLVPVKGYVHLIDALSLLPPTIAGRPLHLVLLENGALGPRLTAQAGLNKRIIWANWQSDPAPYYQLADLVVFPSLEKETLGNVTLKARAWSKPLVISRFCGAREITQHGEDAWCVPCANGSAMARGIEHVLHDPSLRAVMIVQGRRWVRKEFSRKVIMDRYLALYRELTGR